MSFRFPQKISLSGWSAQTTRPPDAGINHHTPKASRGRSGCPGHAQSVLETSQNNIGKKVFRRKFVFRQDFQDSRFGLARGGIRLPEGPWGSRRPRTPPQVIRGRARARKPSDIERQSSPGSPRTSPGTWESIGTPQARLGAPEKNVYFPTNLNFF